MRELKAKLTTNFKEELANQMEDNIITTNTYAKTLKDNTSITINKQNQNIKKIYLIPHNPKPTYTQNNKNNKPKIILKYTKKHKIINTKKHNTKQNLRNIFKNIHSKK